MDDPTRYCCPLHCFRRPRCEVDGLACVVCQSFSYCRCRCQELPPRQYQIRRHRDVLRFEFSVGERCPPRSQYLVVSERLFDEIAAEQLLLRQGGADDALVRRFSGPVNDAERELSRRWHEDWYATSVSWLRAALSACRSRVKSA